MSAAFIDRLACALHGGDATIWENLSPSLKSCYRQDVRRILREARQPDRDMLNAAEGIGADRIWKAMMDKGLEP
jgi:hypothetical protein